MGIGQAEVDMNIRKAVEDDRAQVIGMSGALYRSGAALHPIGDAQISRTFDEVMGGSPFVSLYIAELDGRTAGYVLLAHTYSNEAGGPVVWIEEIYVKPELRGGGLGMRLLRFVEQEYAGRAARIRLEVDRANAGAKRLYAGSGYSELPYDQMVRDISRP
jgi:GNAT superfamily N-acetyltransferase